MPLDTVVNRFSAVPLEPSHNPDLARRQNANFAPLSVIVKGTIVGQVAATANDVQTFSITGTPTGGTFTLSGINPLTQIPFTTGAIAYNANAAAVQTALVAALGTGNVAVTGGALPGVATVATLAGALVSLPMQTMTANLALVTGGTPVFSIAHTTTGAIAGTYVASPPVAHGITMYDIATDAGGRVTLGTAATGGYYGEVHNSATIYTSGQFYTSDLTGLTAQYLLDLGGSKISNTEITF